MSDPPNQALSSKTQDRKRPVFERTPMAGKGFTVKKDWDNPIEHPMPAEARVPAKVRIGTVLVAPATVLAPMAGVTDTVFRRFIRHASLFSTTSRSLASD